MGASRRENEDRLSTWVKVLERAGEADPAVCEQGIGAILRSGSISLAVPALIAVLRRDGPLDLRPIRLGPVSAAALCALEQAGSAAIPHLLQLARDSDPFVRIKAA